MKNSKKWEGGEVKGRFDFFQKTSIPEKTDVPWFLDYWFSFVINRHFQLILHGLVGAFGAVAVELVVVG